MRIDLHTHSNVSDGTDTPAELVVAAHEAGLDVVALTDHDTFDGLDRAVAAGREHGVEVVHGMELSCSRQGQSVHLLAYGADPEAAALAEEMVRVREGRSGRLRPVLDLLAGLGVPVTEEEVMAQVGSSPSVGRPHIADALVAAGWVEDRTEAFDRFLADGGPAHVGRYAIEVGHGIDLVHQAGGVAVIAHPWGRGRAALLPEEFLTELVERHGLDGVEVDHQDHDAEARAELWALVDRLGVLGTGSSDYHGTGKTDHGLGVNTTRPEVYDELRKRLRVAV
ncbi:PHP domain-containing protein [Microlunatus spumicola]|uniref:PHP domain-containing protein n=1 Tax=Microlunatus spumicola TaxID=81499 RepID=A0ABP6WVZ0_9ACTN